MCIARRCMATEKMSEDWSKRIFYAQREKNENVFLDVEKYQNVEKYFTMSICMKNVKKYLLNYHLKFL